MPMVPKAAEVYRQQIIAGLDGKPEATAKARDILRRWLPVLHTSLLCSANVFAEEPGGGTRALLERLVGAWDVGYDFTDKTEKVRSDAGQVHYDWILPARYACKLRQPFALERASTFRS